MILIYLQQDLRLSLERVFYISVEHNLADKFEKNDEFEIFKEKCLQSQFQGIDNKEKLCFFTNLYAINPFTDKDIPIVFTNYVLMGYGTEPFLVVLRMIKETLSLQKNTILKF